MDNHQLSEHIACVQLLLHKCGKPANREKHSEGERMTDWYRYWKPSTHRLCLQDLCSQPTSLVANVNGFSNINVTSTGVKVAEGSPISDYDSIKRTAHNSLHNIVSSTKEEEMYVVSHSLLALWGSYLSTQTSCAPLIRITYPVAQRLPKIGNADTYSTNSPAQYSTRKPNVIAELQDIVNLFARSEDPVRVAYGKDLSSSLLALRKLPNQAAGNASDVAPTVDITVLNKMISSARENLQGQFNLIYKLLVKGHQWYQHGGLLPDITPQTLLEALQGTKGSVGNDIVQNHILPYAVSIVGLQHLLRIRDAHLRKDTIQLASEMRSTAHKGWRVEDQIDWLLLEIDFNLIIREDQLQVARAMIASPCSTSNFVLQMNMGQGKSSVIIPMVAAALADSKNLVRVVVPRSLLLQAAQILSSRLGGLINREIKHIPFSRKSPTDIESIKAYHTLHLETFNRKGVILALPEHLLSFQLSGLQELSNGRISQSNYMIKLQAWFSRRARDILDECDHMLAVKTQLIYPSGSQSLVDGHPNRWKVVQVRGLRPHPHRESHCLFQFRVIGDVHPLVKW